MKIERIFLDLDDVLNTCTSHLLWTIGCSVSPDTYGWFDHKWGYDIIKAANELHAHRRFTPHQFWSYFTSSDWASIPKSREFDFLLSNCPLLVGTENICILSSPTMEPSCLAGKLEWIHKQCPKWLHRQFLFGPPKHHCAAPNTLLIDDNESNVKKFRTAGGKAILVPRPWNALYPFAKHGHAQNMLEDELNKYQYAKV